MSFIIYVPNYRTDIIKTLVNCFLILVSLKEKTGIRTKAPHEKLFYQLLMMLLHGSVKKDAVKAALLDSKSEERKSLPSRMTTTMT